MEAMEWSVEEENSVSIGEKTTRITYHSWLNTILAVNYKREVKILDLHSGVTLQNTPLIEDIPSNKGEESSVTCEYLENSNQVFFTCGSKVGLRKDHSGILLLNSVLQTAVKSENDEVVVELPLTEANLLLSCLKNTTIPRIQHNTKKVIAVLENGIKDCKLPNNHAYHKFTKWATVVLHIPQFDLLTVCSGLVAELVQNRQNVQGISVAASLMDRMKRLVHENVPLWLPSWNPADTGRVVNRLLMFSEIARRETFRMWPHKDYKWAQPDAMAQAGFYHQPMSAGDDRARCFTCNVCLVCWEPTDEPWSEHERHSSVCPYVRGEPTQNVPLATTLATAPAQLHGDGTDKITCVSTTSCPHLIATSTQHGHICVWNVADQLTLATTIVVSAEEEGLLQREKETPKRPPKQVMEAWVEPAGKSPKDFDLLVEDHEPEDIMPNQLPFEVGNIETPSAVTYPVGLNYSTLNGVYEGEDELGIGSKVDLIHPMDSATITSIKSTTLPTAPEEKVILPKINEDITVTSMHIFQLPVKSSSRPENSSEKNVFLAVSISCAKDCGFSNLANEKEQKTFDPKKDTSYNSKGGGEKLGDTEHKGGEDDAGTGVDLTSRNEEFADNLLGDVVDSGKPAESAKHCLRHFLVIYKLSQEVQCPITISNNTPEKTKLLPKKGLLPNDMVSTETKLAKKLFASCDNPLLAENEEMVGPSYFLSCLDRNKKQLHFKRIQCIQMSPEVQTSKLLISNIQQVGFSLVVVFSPNSSSGPPGDSSDDRRSETGYLNGLSRESSALEAEDFPQGGALFKYCLSCEDDEQPVKSIEFEKLCLHEQTDAVAKMIPVPMRRTRSSLSEDLDARQSISGLAEDPMDPSSDGAEEDEIEFVTNTPLNHASNVIVLLTASGTIKLVSVDKFAELTVFVSEGSDLVDMTYCKGLDRLCACTDDGKALILKISRTQIEKDSTDAGVDARGMPRVDIGDDRLEKAKREELFVGSGELTMEKLGLLQELTQFKTLVPRFKATVPPKWTEINQEQQQRRHPQHLHQRKQEDASQHTRTWKLQPDSTSWKEHLFELILPRTCVGHVDVKFGFHATCTNPPNIVVALLRQTGGITNFKNRKSMDSGGKDHSKGVPVDAKINFNMEASSTPKPTRDAREIFLNPFDPDPDIDAPSDQTGRPFLECHKDDIICGPCPLETFVGVPSLSGTVSLASRELLRSTDRSFILYIGAADNENLQEQPRPKSDQVELLSALQNSQQTSSIDKIASSLRKEIEKFKGCDWIQELSITVRRTKKMGNSLPRGERFQRLMMLESEKFHHQLCLLIAGEVDLGQQGQKLALDVLAWIIGIQMSESTNSRLSSVYKVVQKYLDGMIQSCLLDAERTTSHKFSQLLALCIGCEKKNFTNSRLEDQHSFAQSLLTCLLNWLPKMAHANSASALNWFFQLLHIVRAADPEAISQSCMKFLLETSKLLDEKTLKEHVILRSRFGLYGTPLDPELFDAYPQQFGPEPSHNSSGSTTTPSTTTSSSLAGAYSSMLYEYVPGSGFSSGKAPLGQPVSDTSPHDSTINMNFGLVEEGALSFLEGRHFMSGLLEVEPLHFTCCATSDCTQVVKEGHVAVAVTAKTPVVYADLLPPPVHIVPGGGSGGLTGSGAQQDVSFLSSPFTNVISTGQKLIDSIKQLKQPHGTSSQPQQKESLPPTPKNTPFFMTPPLSPPNESIWNSASLSNFTEPDVVISATEQLSQETQGEDSSIDRDSSIPKTEVLRNLMTPPEPFCIVVDRMHPGARRYAVLDFGHPVCLTDIHLPACKDLGSVTIDVWTKGENLDGRRLAVALDISDWDLVLNDILDPPICRYLKITIIGKYGSTGGRSKIPLGSYYGHSVTLSSEQNPPTDSETPLSFNILPHSHLEEYMALLASILEDVHCRYTLSCSQLTNLLHSVEHGTAMQSSEFTALSSSEQDSKVTSSIQKVYKECLSLQKQFVVIQRTILRLQGTRYHPYPPGISSSQALKHVSADTLRVLSEHLLDTLLSLTPCSTDSSTLTSDLDFETCKALFKNLCVRGTPDLRAKTGAVLVKVCGVKPWWGEFIAWALTQFFQQNQKSVFPQDRLFMLLVSLGHKSLISGSSSSLVEQILSLLANQLEPLKYGTFQSGMGGVFDLSLVRWILLFLSCLLDRSSQTSLVQEEESRKLINHNSGRRWTYLSNTPQSLKGKSGITKTGSGTSAQMQTRLKKQLQMHHEKLSNLKTVLKAWKNKAGNKDQHMEFLIKKEIHHHASRHLRDIERIRKLTQTSSKVKKAEGDAAIHGGPDKLCGWQMIDLPRNQCIQVVQGLMQLLLAMDFTCNVDMFMVTCKVLAKLASSTTPSVTLSEVASKEQLSKLLHSCLSRENHSLDGSPRGPWASHAITCLLVDILEGEKSQPLSVPEDTFGAVGGAADDKSMPSGSSRDKDQSSPEGTELVDEDTEPSSADALAGMPGFPQDLEAYFSETSPLPEVIYPKPVGDAQQTLNMVNASLKDIAKNLMSGTEPKTAKEVSKFDMWKVMNASDHTAVPSTSIPFGGDRDILRNRPEIGGNSLMLIPKVSSAMDVRLEIGLEMGAEWFLKISNLHQAMLVAQSFTQSTSDNQHETPRSAGNVVSPSPPPRESSTHLLLSCLQDVFEGLQDGTFNLEKTLRLWLQLNTNHDETQGDGGFNITTEPRVPLNKAACKFLLFAVAQHGCISNTVWCSLFHLLTAVLNQPDPGLGSVEEECFVADSIAADPSLQAVLVKFLSQGTNHDMCGVNSLNQVGPTLTHSFSTFLTCLELKTSSEVGNLLLRVMLSLLDEGGAIRKSVGPLDAQLKFVQTAVDQSYSGVDPDVIMQIAKHTSLLVSIHLSYPGRISLQSLGEASPNARLVELIEKAPRSKTKENILLGTEGNREGLLGSLLQFLGKLLTVELDYQASTSLDTIMERLGQSSTEASHLPMTDSSKLVAASQHGRGTVSLQTGAICDDEKERSGEFMQHASPSRPTTLSSSSRQHPGSFRIVDLILSSQETMSNFLLALKNSTLGDIQAMNSSISDQLYQLMSSFSQEALCEHVLASCLVAYLKEEEKKNHCHVSEYLLWLFRNMLNNPVTFKNFCELGGMEIICKNLVQSSQGSLNSSVSQVSSILNMMGKQSAPPPKPPGPPQVKRTQEVKKENGLTNFATFSTVTSSNLQTTPPDALLHPTASVRRARSAWSYHFYPHETWYDLTINLPCAILLEEVIVTLNSSIVGRCPSAIALEISQDGVTSLPVCPPIPISSLVNIRMVLSRPEVALSTTIRLKRPTDCTVMSLSSVKVLGRPVFCNESDKLSQLDSVEVSVRWLRLLQHCLTISPLRDIPRQVSSIAANTPGLLATCTSLLNIPQGQLYKADIESLLLRLGVWSTEVGLMLMDILLRNTLSSGHQGPSLIGQLFSKASESTVDIIYQLALSPEVDTKERLQALLDWLGDTARVALYDQSTNSRAPHTLSPLELTLLHPSAVHVHCVASVLWASCRSGHGTDHSGLLTKELFSSLYEWAMVLTVNSPLKRAVDYILCSMCHVQPMFYDSLLHWMGVIPQSSLEESLTDDRKEDEISTSQLTDDSKGAGIHLNIESSFAPQPLEDWGHIILDEVHLSTLAAASQSPSAVNKLLNSGFLTKLAEALADFCTTETIRTDQQSLQADFLTDAGKMKVKFMEPHASPRSPRSHSRKDSEESLSTDSVFLTADLIAPVLDFFRHLSHESAVKNWLGSSEGNIFWSPLLTMLCHSSSLTMLLNKGSRRHRKRVLTLAQHASIENSALQFFQQCVSCHTPNQKLLAQIVCEELYIRDGKSGKRNLSGFLRRLILQLMLEDEMASVALSTTCRVQKGSKPGVHQIYHPRYGVGRKKMVLDVRLTTKCSELVAKITEPSLNGSQLDLDKLSNQLEKNNNDPSPFVMVSFGPDKKSLVWSEEVLNTPKEDKPKKNSSGHKVKSSKSAEEPTKATKAPERSGSMPELETLPLPTLSLFHPLLGNVPLPAEITIGQVIAGLKHHGLEEGFSSIEFGVKFSAGVAITDNSKAQEGESSATSSSAFHQSLVNTPNLPSFLQGFAGVGGLALIAEHIPHSYHAVESTNGASGFDKSGIYNPSNKLLDKLLSPDDKEDEHFVESLTEYTTVQGKKTSTGKKPIIKTNGRTMIPPHSLAAFGLFLRLPGYAEVLLREQTKARYLLRLMLGVMEDKDGNNILSTPEASVLPTLPFTALITLFNNTPLSTDDGVMLRRMTLETGTVHLVLACLAVLSHQSDNTTKQVDDPFPELNTNKSKATASSINTADLMEDKNQSYWAKGTGFGTGSTVSGWNAEEALKRQKAEEEHVTCLFRVLSGYIYPNARNGSTTSGFPSLSEDQQQSIFPEVFINLLRQSCLLPAISSYLRNDSVLDMAQHVPLYCSVLEMLRSLAVCANLSHLLLPQDEPSGGSAEKSLLGLLETMKNCVDIYNSKLGNGKAKKERRKPSRRHSKTAAAKEEEEHEEVEPEGLAQLVPEINRTLESVKDTINKLLREKNGGDESVDGASEPTSIRGSLTGQSLDEKYCAIMKKMQFDTYPMITEDADGKLKMNLAHHFFSNVKAAGNVRNASRARRLAQEAVTLSTSLPLSSSSTVFVRCDDDRLDVMKILITGPCETPYSCGCFEFDVFFPSDYPKSPMLVNLETTGQHSVRFNPNLYNDGKVCLSVLNTWHGKPEEKWNGDTSSFLQVLVSIQSLILVAEPYFNEPGYERSRGTPAGTKSSREYDANIMQATVKWAMLEILRNPPPCFKEVIQTHFYLKKDEILQQCESWIQQLMAFCNDKRVGRSVAHHLAALRRHTAQLKEEISKIKPPDNLKEELGLTSEEAATADSQKEENKSSQASGENSDSSSSSTNKTPTDLKEGGSEEGEMGLALNSAVLHEAETPVVINNIVANPVEGVDLMGLPSLLAGGIHDEDSDDCDWDDEGFGLFD